MCLGTIGRVETSNSSRNGPKGSFSLNSTEVGESAVAVVADTWWHAKKALDALPVDWDVGANGGVQPLDITVPAEHLPADCQKITLSPNLDVIREKIKAGELIEGVTVLPRGTHLRIK